MLQKHLDQDLSCQPPIKTVVSLTYIALLFCGKICSRLFGKTGIFKNKHMFLQSLFFHFKYIYDKNGWSDIGIFSLYGSLPYGYTIRKFKDLSRKRNIISYFHHPLKQVYFRVAAGLMTCLKALDFFHTNLFNPLQALPTMKLLYLQLNGALNQKHPSYPCPLMSKKCMIGCPSMTSLKPLNGS